MIALDKPVNVLIVDDDEDDFILLKDHLTDIPELKATIEWASSAAEAEKIVIRNEHDLYFFDYLLGPTTGLELLKKVVPYGIKAPIIFLTGKGDRKMDLEAIRLGAGDYLVKGNINAENLERSIRYSMERLNVTNALKESETRYRSIFERSRDMIYITDDKGKFITVNDSATRIFGYSKEEFLSMNARDLYSDPEDRDKFLDAINKSGIVTNYEVELRDKNKNLKVCIISGSVQRIETDNSICYHGIIHDITRRRRAERDLMIAEKLAMTGRLVRTLAHEVRNPLTNINLSVEQLEYEISNEELQVYFGIIKRNSNRINDLITELLQASRPTDVQMKKTSVNALIEETISLAIDRITLRNIEVIREFEENVSDLILDATVMKIALLNIIINAVEAMPENDGKLQIRTRQQEGQCYISITDNGSGISKENLGRLFEPYFSVKPNGVGLGLATTHNIIQSHNGSIEVESEPGKGTSFTIILNA